MGGFGLELLHCMLHLGARKFVLTSRRGIKSKYQKFVLDRLRSLGVNLQMWYTSEVVVSTHNSNTIEGAKGLIEEANKMGLIGGIFHLALVLNDCLIENQETKEFNERVDSKVKTFENLDKITRDLNLNMDYFVVFSSVTCGRGNAGQSNVRYRQTENQFLSGDFG